MATKVLPSSVIIAAVAGLAFLLAGAEPAPAPPGPPAPPASQPAGPGGQRADAHTLRLVPFPKEVKFTSGDLAIEPGLTITVTRSAAGEQGATDLRTEIIAKAPGECTVKTMAPPDDDLPCVLWLSSQPPSVQNLRAALEVLPEQPEGYALAVEDTFAVVGARQEAGLLHGVQTLRQLIRANLRKGRMSALHIRDWPSLRYRGFSDDITRGPSPTLDTLKREVDLSALLRMNFFTYYLEYQYAFSKHPDIGPRDGSLTPDELKALQAHAKTRGIEIIGNQQSFGHFAMILRHDRYKHLRETSDILNPTDEQTYQLLDDLYSEQAPLLESEFFNVCCDETQGLGTGPSKPVAEKNGVGGVYTAHMKRIHDLLATKYKKRMMMWGDIILMHPDHLAEIPKDTVMLVWGYAPEPSFDKAIKPFADSGYEFFVCPGVSCWNRMVPDFTAAATNICNFVHDGAKSGALGMLNTTWDDDGENLAAYNWYGIAWGAECAWNGSTTSIEDFNRRVGAVLFGEEADSFGQAVSMLSKAHSLPGFDRLFDKVFWKVDIGQLLAKERSAVQQAETLLKTARPALERLRAARSSAKIDAEILDAFIFGAKRVQLLATRILDCNGARVAYSTAVAQGAPRAKAILLLKKTQTILRKLRQEHAELKEEYVRLWNRENRPYSLDRVTQRFDAVLSYYDDVLARLAKAEAEMKESGTAPDSAEIGLEAPPSASQPAGKK